VGHKSFHKKQRRVCGLVFRYMPSITKLPPPTTISRTLATFFLLKTFIFLEGTNLSEGFRMGLGRHSDFTQLWYSDLIQYSVECPHCGERVSYCREHLTRSGRVRCKKCRNLFRISK